MIISQENKNQAGFTLIETLVVLGIMVILATIMIAYNTNSRGIYNLNIEASKMVQIVSLAKSLTMSTFAQNPSGLSGKTYYCGYGVYFNNSGNSNNFCGSGNNYCIFQYIYNQSGYSGSTSPCSSNQLAFSTQSSGNNYYYATPQPNYEYQFSPDISFINSGSNSNSGIVGILFVPPAPTFYVIDSGNNITSPSGDNFVKIQSTNGQIANLDISSQGQTSFQFAR